MKKKISAVVLAAGNSSRMGKSKALLKYDGLTFLESIIAKLESTDINDIFVVLGKNAFKIEGTIKISEKVKILHNSKTELGQISSIQLAIKNLPEGTQGLLLILVDHPLVAQSTYSLLISHARHTSEKIIIPVCKGQRGHPVYFDRKYFNDLLHAPLDQGARYVVRKYHDAIMYIDVHDTGILKDIDLPEEYNKYIGESKNIEK